MWNYIPANTLCHHGIKGQKWGIRRYQNPDGSLTKAGAKRYADEDSQSDDYKTAQAISKKHVSQMSNKELEMFNRRMQLEQTYSSFTKTGASKGRRLVEEVLTDVAKSTAKNTLTSIIAGKKPQVVSTGEMAVKFILGKHTDHKTTRLAKRMGVLNEFDKYVGMRNSK